MGLPEAMTPLYQNKTTASFCLYVKFEGLHDLVPESLIYALNADGEIIARQKVVGGKALLTLPVDDLQDTTMLIGPPLGDFEATTPTPHSPRAGYPLFNPTWRFEPGTNTYCLPSVPENLWRWWLVRSLYTELQSLPERPRRLLVF